MDNLTIKVNNAFAVPTKFDIGFVMELDDETWQGLNDVFQKLNAYEESKLSPEKIVDLQTALKLAVTTNNNLLKLIKELENNQVHSGKWIACGGDSYHCSKCNYETSYQKKDKYCPNCGANNE